MSRATAETSCRVGGAGLYVDTNSAVWTGPVGDEALRYARFEGAQGDGTPCWVLRRSDPDPSWMQLGALVDGGTLERMAAEIARLTALVNTPETLEFVAAVIREAAHQREQWPSEHDAGKTDADWFWLLGYLGGKALNTPADDVEKKRHRIITVAAAAANWHLQVLGVDTSMRPGIAPPGGST